MEPLRDREAIIMEHAIVLTIALQPGVDAEAFEAYFRDEFAKHLEGERLLESTSVVLYRAIDGSNNFTCVTRFESEELNRVSRAAWPFVLLALRDLLNSLRERFPADVSVVTAPTLSLEDLVAEWNEQFGRFMKISLASSEAADEAEPTT
jgi:hypothetical protein